ncbi:MAG: hypothetical protein AAF211_17155 [Myxococcota bacterium]
MTKRLLVVSALALAACSARSQLPLELTTASASLELEALPEYVELLHDDYGWVRVDATTTDGSATLARAEPARLELNDVPRGSYSAIRLGTVVQTVGGYTPRVASSNGVAANPGLSGTGTLPEPGLIETAFCVKDKVEDRIVVEVQPASPSPTFELVGAPQCDG